MPIFRMQLLRALAMMTLVLGVHASCREWGRHEGVRHCPGASRNLLCRLGHDLLLVFKGRALVLARYGVELTASWCRARGLFALL